MLKVQFGIANLIRASGQALDRVGRQLELNPFVESGTLYCYIALPVFLQLSDILSTPYAIVQPCTKVVKLGSSVPKISDDVFVAQSAKWTYRLSLLCGMVQLSEVIVPVVSFD